MNIFTIGFAQKDAKTFFNLLDFHNIDCLIDIRLNNKSQLAGFTKGKDLEFFLFKILNIKYYHETTFAPTKDILDNYKNKKISWNIYEKEYLNLIKKRKSEDLFKKITFNKHKNICLLCSEPTSENCHRRLFAEYIKQEIPNIFIKHI